ncbi:MAG: hypothetical protein PHU46_12370 [Rhodocyclaceae bacterium]|nr:hypothetical protein [Rhodocyclaceae bacterium]
MSRTDFLRQLAQEAALTGKSAADWLIGLTESAVHATSHAPSLPHGPGKIAANTADYLRSIARRTTNGNHADAEIELYDLFLALKTWPQASTQQLLTLVIRLAKVAGPKVSEFIFRVSRAALTAFNLAVADLGRILLEVGRTVIVVSAVVVAVVLLGLLIALTLPLGVALAPLIAICCSIMAVLTVIQNLAEILSAMGFPVAADAYSEWYRENSWLGAMIAALNLVGALCEEVCRAVFTAGLDAGLSLVGMARTLLNVGFPSERIGKALIFAWSAVRSRTTQSIGALAQALKSVLGWTAEQVGTALTQAYLTTDDAWDAVTAAFTTTYNQLAEIFKSAGASTIADKLKNKAHASAEDVARALKNVGFSASTVAQALKDKFNQGLVDVAIAMKNAGWPMGDVVGGLSNAFNMARSAVELALRTAGLM